jgi:hypothetical protein
MWVSTIGNDGRANAAAAPAAWRNVLRSTPLFYLLTCPPAHGLIHFGVVTPQPLLAAAAALLALPLCLPGQRIPDPSCTLEDYPLKSVVAWQFPQVMPSVQVAVLRDPAGEQEARFDLHHGASLISLRYRGAEMLYGQSAGADVALFAFHQPLAEMKDRSPYWTAFNPDQGGTSMGVPSTVAGVACDGQRSLRAFAMMIDRNVDNSFQKDKLLGVWAGRISDNFPPGYSSPYTIETIASWTPNPSGASPRYFLKLEQSVVNTRGTASGPISWFLSGAAPWDYGEYAAYPDNCTEKTPCSSAATPALASGHYLDATRRTGFATVVPTRDWRTSKAFLRDNAEFVVLLYGAVWAAPRRTFAASLERALAGSEPWFRFEWYVCAGPWSEARQFAAAQPRSSDAPLPVPPLPPSAPFDSDAVKAACTTTEYRMQPNQPEQAVVLKDPAGEQTVLFDMAEGGAIVSLKYRGVEHIWGYNGGGLLQMAFHNGMTHGPWSGDYNPTQAGDGSANSPVTGVACRGTTAINTMTMMLDFNHNNAFYEKPLIAVWDGRVNAMLPPSYFSPYALETRASWVPNPAGVPRYYLKLEERFTHVAAENVGAFGFDFAAYAPWHFPKMVSEPANCPCDPAATRYTAGGFYRDDLSDGLGVAMPARNFTSGKIVGGGTTEPMWRNHSFHLSGTASLEGIGSKNLEWYVMVGPWKSAAAFARTNIK